VRHNCPATVGDVTATSVAAIPSIGIAAKVATPLTVVAPLIVFGPASVAAPDTFISSATYRSPAPVEAEAVAACAAVPMTMPLTGPVQVGAGAAIAIDDKHDMATNTVNILFTFSSLIICAVNQFVKPYSLSLSFQNITSGFKTTLVNFFARFAQPLFLIQFKRLFVATP
jgi:hypothetical protein